jgi:hypothetical protein
MSKLRKQAKRAKNRTDSKKQQRLNKATPAPHPTSLLQRTRHKWWFSALEWALGSAVGALAIVASISGIWGPIWPTDPEIHSRDALNGSSFILPFTVKNKSILFDIVDAEFTCGVDWVFFKDANGNSGTFTDIAFANGVFSVGSEKTINYPCNASELIKIKSDGSLALRNLPLALPTPFYPPLEVKKMCLWIRVEYKIARLIPRKFTSVIFQWPAAPGVEQWLEGAAPGGKDKMEQIMQRVPPAAVNCSLQPREPSLRFERDGTSKLRIGDR